MDIKVEKRGSFYYAIGKAIGVGLTEKAAIENAEKNAELFKGKHFEEFVKKLWFLRKFVDEKSVNHWRH